jgi:uncharacterized HhH-GPD family protein
MTQPERLPFTPDPAAQELLATNPSALLVGIVLYQQVTVEKAFSSPYVLQERLGHAYDVAEIAAIDPEKLEALFREKPALHRFPANMAKRTQAVCVALVEEFDGNVTKLWSEASTADEVMKNMTSLPGFGDYKARVYFGVLQKWFGVSPTGWEEVVPDWPTIQDVDTVEDLQDLKVRKKMWKESTGG